MAVLGLGAAAVADLENESELGAGRQLELRQFRPRNRAFVDIAGVGSRDGELGILDGDRGELAARVGDLLEEMPFWRRGLPLQ